MNVVGTASVAALAAVGIALVRSRRRGSMSNVPIARRGESFRLHLEGYFTEQQHGRTLNLVLEYGYAGVLPLESMPDYRLIQLLVEEVLYIYDADWLDIFWEVANRELVRRLLAAFPQLSWARSDMSVVPSELLPIARMSSVEWCREDLAALGDGTANFFRPLPDACYYPSAVPCFNIAAPRYLLKSLADLYRRLEAAKDSSGEGEKVALSFVPTCLAAASGTYDELLALCTVHGVYDAIILPKRAAHGLKRVQPVGSLTGIVEVKRDDAPNGAGGVVEHMLHSLLGAPPKFVAASHATARSSFFRCECSRMLLEERFAAPLTLRGFASTPAFEGEPLELCISPKLTGAPRVAAAIRCINEAL